jgi:hypothetical protein
MNNNMATPAKFVGKKSLSEIIINEHSVDRRRPSRPNMALAINIKLTMAIDDLLLK